LIILPKNPAEVKKKPAKREINNAKKMRL